MRRSIYIVFFFTFCWVTLSAQSPQFSQFYANQVYLNPAFTGNTEINRIAANYRNQWAGLPQAFNSFSVAYDHNLAQFNTGLGLIAVHDQAGAGGLSYTNFSALGAYKFQVMEEIWISAGMSFGFSIRSADASKYVFGDELITGGETKTTLNQNNTFGDLGTGVLIYGLKFWGGLSMMHLNRPDESLVFGQTNRMPIQWSIHGGYNFALEETDKGEVTKSIIPTANIKFSRKAGQLDLGAYYQRKKFIMGLWYRGLLVLKKNDDGRPSQDALVVMLGVQSKSMRIGYSYDITTSRFGVQDSYGSHELSIVYEWPTKQRKKKKRKKNFIVPCPKF